LVWHFTKSKQKLILSNLGNFTFAMADEEYERFEITDYDLQNEFNPNRYRKRTSKQQQIYGKFSHFFRFEAVSLLIWLHLKASGLTTVRRKKNESIGEAVEDQP
jgi:Tuftelin interacting protein N terminal